jgi:hypothetical protein
MRNRALAAGGRLAETIEYGWQAIQEDYAKSRIPRELLRLLGRPRP